MHAKSCVELTTFKRRFAYYVRNLILAYNGESPRNKTSTYDPCPLISQIHLVEVLPYHDLFGTLLYPDSLTVLSILKFVLVNLHLGLPSYSCNNEIKLYARAKFACNNYY